jgi:caffeoyl-CoA O-methyltransferase
MAAPPVGRHRVVDLDILEYVAANSTQPDPVQRDLQQATQTLTGRSAIMQIGHEQAVMMETLVRATGARQAIEVGTFTGYSALAIARGLPADGHLLCCDTSAEWGEIARAHWAQAGLADRIELRIGPALETLRALPREPQFDFAFIDADKPEYPAYYDELLPRLRQGGLLLADNTLSNRGVVNPAADDPSTVAMRTFNPRLAADPRVRVSILTVGDGVTLVEKL